MQSTNAVVVLDFDGVKQTLSTDIFDPIVIQQRLERFPELLAENG